MTGADDRLSTHIARLQRLAPEYLDLLTAKTDEEFEAAFDTLLARAVDQLERNKKNFCDLGEEGLSAALAMALSIPGLTVVQEANSNGHVDLTIEADHCSPPRIKLGEAKIYKGFKYHVAGLGQLLTRYSTGREGRGLLIVYVQKSNIAGLVKSLRNEMDEQLPLKQQAATAEHLMKWSFVSCHLHSCGEILQVGHVACNLCPDE